MAASGRDGRQATGLAEDWAQVTAKGGGQIALEAGTQRGWRRQPMMPMTEVPGVIGDTRIQQAARRTAAAVCPSRGHEGGLRRRTGGLRRGPAEVVKRPVLCRNWEHE